ncbi:MAG: hypothetical protein MZV70_07160 [Desulfobacterales bacterium]|nr:hypothetical protein [Desulfobacterales bacterium]
MKVSKAKRSPATGVTDQRASSTSGRSLPTVPAPVTPSMRPKRQGAGLVSQLPG